MSGGQAASIKPEQRWTNYLLAAGDDSELNEDRAVPNWERKTNGHYPVVTDTLPSPGGDPERPKFSVPHHIYRRWVHFLLLVVILSLVGVVVLGLRGKVDEGTKAYFATVPTWIRHTAIVALCSVFSYLAGRLLRPSWAHVNRQILRHPPTWAAAIVSVCIVCAADLSDLIGPASYRGTIGEWAGYVLPSWCLVALLLWSSRVETRTKSNLGLTDRPRRELHELAEDESLLHRWALSETHAEEDLLGTRRVAIRLAEYLATDLHSVRTVGIVGDFGAGKTSVVKWVVEELAEGQPGRRQHVLTCEVSCWGFEDSSTASEYILKKAVKTAGDHVDCFWFRSLPETYRKSFSAGGDWVRNLSDLLIGTADVYEQFERLSQLLECLSLRLVIVIEDLDREQSSRFERQEIQALLYRLRQYPSLSFIITGGISDRSGIDYNRLCDRVEYLPALPHDLCLAIISRFRRMMLNDYPENYYLMREDHDPWQSRQMFVGPRERTTSYVTGMVRLLSTPRNVKAVLRQTAFAWRHLNGEVDLDHLLCLVAIRHAANPAYEFFIDNAQYVREHSSNDELAILRPRLQNQWARATEGAGWDVVSARSIVEHLSPRMARILSTEDRGNGVRNMSSRVQGVEDRSYLQRILNEALDAGEPSDQTVLRGMADWVGGRRADAELVTGVSSNPSYARSWHYFAQNDAEWRGDRLLEFAGQVIAGHDVRGDEYRGGFHQTHEGMTSLWMLLDNRVPRDDRSYLWLESQVRHAISRSLVLAENLYYYWGSRRYGILPQGGRTRLREFICTIARSQFTRADQLLAVLHPTNAFELYWLVSPPGDDGGDGDEVVGPEMRGVGYWNWLGPILRDALAMNPSLVGPKIARLIADLRDRGPFVQPVAVIDPQSLNGFFPNSQFEILNALRSEGMTRQDEDGPYMVAVADSGFSFLSSAAPAPSIAPANPSA